MSKKLILSVAAVGGLIVLASGLPVLLRARVPVVQSPVPPPSRSVDQALPSLVPGPGAHTGAATAPPPPAVELAETSTVQSPRHDEERSGEAGSGRPAIRHHRGAQAELDALALASPAPAISPSAGRVDVGKPSANRGLGLRSQLMKKDEGRIMAPPSDFNREGYDHIRDNPFLAVGTNPLSTFSIDVDTASYANVRRFLTAGQLPPKDAVRIEELVNYFQYDYPEPEGHSPFSITTELSACPWRPEHRLALVGLRGRSVDELSLPPRNLVFLLDVSGSMNSPDKLPLLKRAMGLLVDTLREEDRVAIVVYAGASGLVLSPTSGGQRGDPGRPGQPAGRRLHRGRRRHPAGLPRGVPELHRRRHQPGDPRHRRRFQRGSEQRGGPGASDRGEARRPASSSRSSGSVGQPQGLEDGEAGGQRQRQLRLHRHDPGGAQGAGRPRSGGTLVTIAKDVKIQVEFNPARVSAYRLVGYENRALRAEDFNDDKKDAGEIGAGHTVTALYEIVPVGVSLDLPTVDPLKYQQPAAVSGASGAPELLTVKLRHKEPERDESRLTSVVLEDAPGRTASADLRFSAAVAAFGMLLRDSEHKGSASWTQVIDLAGSAVGSDPEGHRTEFLVLARNAMALATMEQVAIAR